MTHALPRRGGGYNRLYSRPSPLSRNQPLRIAPQPPVVDILKSQYATQLTIQDNHRAHFCELLPGGAASAPSAVSVEEMRGREKDGGVGSEGLKEGGREWEGLPASEKSSLEEAWRSPKRHKVMDCNGVPRKSRSPVRSPMPAAIHC